MGFYDQMAKAIQEGLWFCVSFWFWFFVFFFFFFCLFVFLPFLGPLPRHMEIESRLGDRIRAVAASLHHSHSNMGTKLHLRPQLTARLDF